MRLKVLSLEDAVHEIVDATRPQPWHSTPQSSRFFFIVGAGISFPAIPLAAGIEELCRKEIERRGRVPSAMNALPIERYETHFQQAFPHPEDRRAFLHYHIKSAPISAANFRLAHLVGSKRLTNLVFTTNFDELFTRALRLFGEDVIVCDHPRTTQRIDPKRDDFQVVHVHGTHWFYDCCNLKDEIEGRAQDDRESNASMSHLLDRMLHDRAPLVVGYAGWEGDVVMAALKRRLSTPLSSNLYWFCYRRSDMDVLPNWLKNNANVRFVVPPEHAKDRGEANALPNGGNDPARAVFVSAGLPNNVGNVPPVQSARQVFDALIRGLDLEEPKLTKEPLGFFATQLQRNLASPELSDEDDVYLIRQLIRSVEDGAVLTRQERDRRTQKEKENAEFLGLVSKALRSAAYSEVLTVARKIDFGSLSDVQRTDLYAALESLYLGSAGQSLRDFEEQLESCEMRLRISRQSLSLDGKNSDWLLSEAKALHGQGYCLNGLGRQAEALAAYDEVARRFGDSSETALRERVAKALVNKGRILDENEQDEEAVSVYDEIVSRFGNSSEKVCSMSVAWALVNKGVSLVSKGDRVGAIAAWDEVLHRFMRSPELDLRENAVLALLNKGLLLSDEGRKSEAVVVYDEIIRIFGDALELVLKVHVARALLNKGTELGGLGSRPNAIAAWDEIVSRFGSASDSVLKEQVALALIAKGRALLQGGMPTDAIANYDEVVRQLGDCTDASLAVQVASALINKGLALDEQGDFAASAVVYDEIICRFSDYPESHLKKWVAWAVINKGSALSRLGRHAEGVSVCETFLHRFGDLSGPGFEELIAQVLFNKAFLLGMAGRQADSLSAYDEVIRRFGGATRPALIVLVAEASLNKGVALDDSGDELLAASVYSEIIQRFGNSSDVALKVLVGKSLINMGMVFRKNGNPAKAVGFYEQVVRRFGEDSEVSLQEQVARALVEKGVVWVLEGRGAGVVEVCDEVERRFFLSSEAVFYEQVERAPHLSKWKL